MNHNENKNNSVELTFTAREIARALNISNATLLRWLKVGKIEGFFRVGRKWLIRKSDFDAFINQQIINSSK